MQEYFDITNEEIQRPNTTNPGIIDYFAEAGYLISVKAPNDTDRGKVFICANVDSGAPNYAATKLALCTMIKDCVVAGVVSQGSESSAITLPNAQSFDFKYNLPDRHAILLRLTITLSSNNQFTVLSDVDVAQKLFTNINAKYRLGLDFEPQRYFSVIDAPWAAEVLLEYSLNAGADWESEVYDAEYDDLLEFDVEDIEIVNT